MPVEGEVMVTVNRSYGGTWYSFLDDVPDANPPQLTLGGVSGTYQDSIDKGGNWKDWRQRLKSHLPCTTSISGNIRTIKSRGTVHVMAKRFTIGDPSLSYRQSGKVGELNWQFFQPIGPSTLSLTSANNAALSRFVQKADSLVSAFQGITFIGEIRETIQMIRNPFRLLHGNISRYIGKTGKIRRRRGESNGALRDRISDIWLENAFGWQPLVHDIDNGMQALSRLGRTPRPNQRVSGAQTDRKFLAPLFVPQSQAFGDFITTIQSEESASVKYHGLVLLDWEEYSQGFTHFGIRLDSVLPAVWELIPYSFLADYFTNLGDIIQASSFAASRLAWVEKGTEKRSHGRITASWSRPVDTSINRFEVLSGTCNHEIDQTHRAVERTDYSGQSLVPKFEFQVPGLSMKWLNILALGQQHKSAARRVYG